jgi:hypothetical protein
MANEDALTRRLDALSGGAPLPQAATMTIARRLLGPGLADRYGDVIGARPSTLADTARDFAVGFISGDPTRADALKARVMESYREELSRTEEAARQREDDARRTVGDFFQLLTQGKKVPKDLRKDFFKESLPKIGIDPTSPLFLKILSDTDKFGDIYDALADPELQRLSDEDPIAAVQRLISMGHDGGEALQVAQSIQQMRRYRADTERIVAQTKRTQGLTQEDPTARARASFVSRMAGRTVKDRLGRQRVLSPDEILAMADRFFPTGAAPEVAPEAAPEVAPPVGIPQGTVTTTPTTTAETVTPTTGIAQAPAASPPAEAGKQKVKRITGTVTRVE